MYRSVLRSESAANRVLGMFDLVHHGPDTFVGEGPRYPWGRRELFDLSDS